MTGCIFSNISIKQPALSYLMHSALNCTLQILFCDPYFTLGSFVLYAFVYLLIFKKLDDTLKDCQLNLLSTNSDIVVFH